MLSTQWFIARYFTRRMSAIAQWIAHPYALQQRVLDQLLAQAKNTAFGRAHDFEQLHTLSDYKRAVPVHDYDDLKGTILNMLDGQPNLLWPGLVRYFAKSSGTTSDKSKYIPVSNDALRHNHYKGSKDLMALYCAANPKSRLYTGKGLAMGGSQQILSYHNIESTDKATNKRNPSIRVGDLSAILLAKIPAVGRYLRTPPLEVATMPDWEEKLALTAQIAVQQNITHLAGVPTWNLLLLKKILAQTGKAHLGEIWPNLELYFHGGVNFEPYRAQFSELIPLPAMQYWQTYNASEGFFALQENPFRDDMLLMTNAGIFYEFMPLEELGNAYPQTLDISEVEVGHTYAIVISTNGGLWRYLLGDTVRITTLNPFRITVAGRTKQYINAFGEEVMVENTDHALKQACLQTGAAVSDYTAAPFYADTSNCDLGGNHAGGHEWLIEFERAPDSSANFARLLDKGLQAVNSDYEAKRFNDIAMLPPRIGVLPKGTFYSWLKSKGKLGGQHKVPRLANNRLILEDIKQFAEAEINKNKG